jgi:sugar O-acyltransferase (sialic acid O-acetyltransferase NeuD family)
MSGAAPIVIIGAGGHGRGILEILLAAARATGAECPVVGFLDDDPGLVGAMRGGRPVLGGLDELPRLMATGHQFLLGVGDPRARREQAGRITAAGIVYARAVHPRATLYSDVEVAPGCVVAAGVTVAAATRLGEHTLLNLNATVGHDCVLEAFATVGPGANIGGNVKFGQAAFASLNATVLPGLTVGANSQVGAGSVLLEDLEPDRVAFGVPARVVSRLNSW